MVLSCQQRFAGGLRFVYSAPEPDSALCATTSAKLLSPESRRIRTQRSKSG
jgi:hypothetical protein